MSLFNYIAILGRQPELGLMELESVVGAEHLQPFGRQAALLNASLDIARLGGVQKLGRVLYNGPTADLRQLPIDVDALPLAQSKTPFAISVYGLKATRRFVETAGLALKKRLRERGSVRLVAPSEGLAVSAAQLRHNDVLERGFELLLVVSKQQMVVAQTVGVQDIDWYSQRDYGRPARSAKVGMLPPKLAQMLVNTVHAPVVADPFCGTGVVLQEALLLGREAAGSDLSGEMVEASRANLGWLAERPEAQAVWAGAAGRPDWRVQSADARQVQLSAACAVVSEGYLGPNQVHSPTPAELRRIKAELLELYRASLAQWARQLPAGAEVSLCVPAWRVGRSWQYLGLVDELPQLGYTLKGFQHVQTPLLYAREDQVVGRQLLLLRKI